MKFLLYALISFFLISCEYSTVTHSVCNSKYQNIKNLEGQYLFSIDGKNVEALVKNNKVGEYSLFIKGEFVDKFMTCTINGTVFSDSPIEDSIDLQLSRFEISHKELSIESIIFDMKLLDVAGIDYTYNTSILGGSEVSVILIDNKKIKLSELLKYEMISSARLPFKLSFQRK